MQYGRATAPQERFRDLVAESGGPGCDVLCGRRGGLLRKLCWLVVVTFLVAQCIHECLLVFSEYAAFPVATSYSSDQGMAMAFPDVTICNVNPLRRSRICAYRASLPGGKGVLKKILDRDCSDNITYSDPNAGDRELLQQLHVWMAQRRKEERSTVRRLFRLGHQLGDTVTYCRYARRNCTEPRYFSQTFDTRYGNCFCFHCGTTDQKDEQFFQYETAGSPADGLELLLNAQADEYLPTSMETGFVVMVHGHGYRPVLCNDAVFVEPGYVTYISLRMEKRTALPEPYQFPCRSSWPNRFRGFGLNYTMYTREDCLSLCQQEHTRRMCGCESRDLPTTSNRRGAKAYPICEEKREQCVKEVQAIMGIESVEKLCKCHRSCVNVEYHKEISRAFLPESFMIGPDGNRRSVVRVVIYFNSVSYLKLTSVPKYDGGRVVSSFGGINGMYLGVSFFVLFGMLETVVRAAWLLWRRPATAPRRDSSSDGDASSAEGKRGVHEKSAGTGGMVKMKTDPGDVSWRGRARSMRFRSRIPPPRVWNGRIHEPHRSNRAEAVGPVDRHLKKLVNLTSTSLADLPVLPRTH